MGAVDRPGRLSYGRERNPSSSLNPAASFRGASGARGDVAGGLEERCGWILSGRLEAAGEGRSGVLGPEYRRVGRDAEGPVDLETDSFLETQVSLRVNVEREPGEDSPVVVVDDERGRAFFQVGGFVVQPVEVGDEPEGGGPEFGGDVRLSDDVEGDVQVFDCLGETSVSGHSLSDRLIELAGIAGPLFPVRV